MSDSGVQKDLLLWVMERASCLICRSVDLSWERGGEIERDRGRDENDATLYKLIGLQQAQAAAPAQHQRRRCCYYIAAFAGPLPHRHKRETID